MLQYIAIFVHGLGCIIRVSIERCPDKPLNREKGLNMARPKNPERIAREDLVTRTIVRFNFKFRYVPKGGNSIEEGSFTAYGNEQSATRKATAYARTHGTLIDSVELVSKRGDLIGQSIDEFIKGGKILEENIEIE